MRVLAGVESVDCIPLTMLLSTAGAIIVYFSLDFVCLGPGSSGLEHGITSGAEHQLTGPNYEEEHCQQPDLALISDSGQQQQSLWIRTKPLSSSSTATAGHLTLKVNSNESPPLASSSWTPLLHNLSTESIL